MEQFSLPKVVYLNHSLERLDRLRPDQRECADALIDYMHGTSFGTAILPVPFSQKVEFYPSIDHTQSAMVNIGKVRLTVKREAGRILVSAKGR